MNRGINVRRGLILSSLFLACICFTDGQGDVADSNSTPQIQPLPAILPSVLITEEHWVAALNNKVFKGNIGVVLSAGRADIVTDTKVVEVNDVLKYNEGVEQVLKYAQAAGKEPVLALYIDGQRNGFELFQHAGRLCKEKSVTLLLVNSFVSVNDLISLVAAAKTDSPEQQQSTTYTPPKISHNSAPKTTNESGYWLNTQSGVRHNKGCRYYKKTSQGRPCSANEGKPCKICGG